MCWRTLRIRLRKQPRVVLFVTVLKSLRIQDHRTQSDVGFVALPGLNQVDNAANGFWPRTEVHKPFLVPDRIQLFGCYFAERRRKIRPTERAESVFRPGAD